jgi:hypothetical protein
MEHIQQLKPKNFNRTLAGFTRKWIHDSNAGCPPFVDNKILVLMHDKKIYNPEPKDNKLVLLIEELRKGTEIESLKDGMEYNIIEERILDRIRVLAQDLLKKKFIVRNREKYHQAEQFKECWENKEQLWKDYGITSNKTPREEPPRAEAASTSTAIDPVENDDDDDDGLFVGPAPTPPPAAKPPQTKSAKAVCNYNF